MSRGPITEGCPFCLASPGQRCFVRGSGEIHPLIGRDYYGPTSFHAARSQALAASIADDADGPTSRAQEAPDA